MGRKAQHAARGSRMDGSHVPEMVRGKRSAIAYLYNRYSRRLLVLSQSKRRAVTATAQELPRAVGADAEMGRG